MTARDNAYQILAEVEKGAFANLVLDKKLETANLSLRDRAFVTELVYGTVKYQRKLDWIIDQFVKKPGKLETGPRCLLRLALYQLLFLDKVPVSAVTNEAVKSARKYFHAGIAGLVNGVLRTYLRQPEKVVWPEAEKDPLAYLEVCYSHPRWMLERWLDRYGFNNTEGLCRFNNNPADLWIRTNTLRCSREDLAKVLEVEGCRFHLSRRVPEGICLDEGPGLASLRSFQQGLFLVQDESSMLVAHAVAPKPGDRVLDVCAGPGGKTTHLAQLMEDRGLILACDVHQHRLRLIEENARRLGINCIRTKLQDASQFIPDGDIPSCSLILVDAPCSGLGVLRRRPDSRWRKSPRDVANLSQLQEQILESASRLLSPGGRLIYSTCTLEPEENTEVVTSFLKRHRDYKTLDLNPYITGEGFSTADREEMRTGMMQFLPFIHDMDGFFIAGLEKM